MQIKQFCLKMCDNNYEQWWFNSQFYDFDNETKSVLVGSTAKSIKLKIKQKCSTNLFNICSFFVLLAYNFKLY